MATVGSLGAVVGQLERLWDAGTAAGLSEGQLLDRFVATGDEAAFAALVARHGPMVRGVCRRALGEGPDADDAFQATFLVLVKRARTLRDRDLLPNWLYVVARRVASRSRASSASRRRRESPAGPDALVDARPHSVDEAIRRDLASAVQREVDALPESYRAAVVLCDLSGCSHEEAARRLRWPLGTVKGRHFRARRMLRDRLARRGLGAASAGVLAPSAVDAALPVPLVQSTIRAAIAVAAGGATLSGSVPAQVAALAQGVLSAMSLSKLKLAAATLAVAGFVTAGAAVSARGVGPADGPGQAEGQKTAPVDQKTVAPEAPPNQPDLKTVGPSQDPTVKTAVTPEEMAPETNFAIGVIAVDPTALPPDPDVDPVMEAEARTGLAVSTLRRLENLKKAGEEIDESVFNSWKELGETSSIESTKLKKARLQGPVVRAKAALAEATAAKPSRSKELAVMKAKLAVIEAEAALNAGGRDYENYRMQIYGIYKIPPSSSLVVKRASSDPRAPGILALGSDDSAGDRAKTAIPAEAATKSAPQAGNPARGVAAAGSKPSADSKTPAGGGGGEQGVGFKTFDDTSASKFVATKLETQVSFNFPNETPLEDILKYMRSATRSTSMAGTYKGIKYYVDPASLVQVERQLTSTVTIDLEDVPLRLAMKLTLAQFGLTYIVRDGVMIIVANDLDLIEGLDGSLRDELPPPRLSKDAKKLQ